MLSCSFHLIPLLLWSLLVLSKKHFHSFQMTNLNVDPANIFLYYVFEYIFMLAELKNLIFWILFLGQQWFHWKTLNKG